MARILSIDYGTKRTGLAVSDPLQIIASGLDTVDTKNIFDYLQHYIAAEEVETIVVGDPKYPDGNPSQIAHMVLGFIRKLRKMFPEIEVVPHDERYTSEDAKKIILQSGVNKKKRRDKRLVDKISAVLILQDYMEEHRQ
ncbi:MAG: Holliday junction resolvase RuvX [Saprospiraceae bacterium]|nr:Holliday junction resolvase RuvX [Saprospiraceae bacterium]MCB9326075.1 Holliday junction resolvase RuvX [Lewinellaceae bacterium]